MLNMDCVRRIVVKVGSSTLTHPNGKLNIRRIEHLVRCICDLRNRGYEMVLVSSGAIAVGANKMGLAERPKTLAMKQAAAAVGQCELMHIYDKMFLEYGITVAQMLLTRHDIVEGSRRDNIQNTFDALLQCGNVPIVNENDSVAIEEVEALESFGDNDTLSAVVARLCQSDLLVIFTDMDGLFDSDPRKNPQAKLIPAVHTIDHKLRRVAGGAGTANGTGGMATKLGAAELCMDAGIPMLVTNGESPENLYEIVDGKQIGTLFCRKGALTT
ncbi:glutamate 5-kinase [Intestinibacillus massiliensis]|uniref:glutamate 5-kinase n=1 Tax=Intestinibacillus massiliensis TaxID=1871029 RepID=UPI001F2BC57F|nr:glutamate 5-kinase [Intestinibacillus massiliensis]